MSPTVHRHRLAAVRKHHPAALPRAAREEVLAQVKRGELVEKRVDPRAVVALGVVLGHDLPVRPDVVLQPGCAPKPAEVPLEARVVPEPVVQVGLQPGRRIVEAKEDPAAPDLRPDRGESGGREAELLEVLGVPGPDEPPVQVVDPGVVLGTGNGPPSRNRAPPPACRDGGRRCRRRERCRHRRGPAARSRRSSRAGRSFPDPGPPPPAPPQSSPGRTIPRARSP